MRGRKRHRKKKWKLANPGRGWTEYPIYNLSDERLVSAYETVGLEFYLESYDEWIATTYKAIRETIYQELYGTHGEVPCK
jgi:hypothetical protein